MSSCAGRSVGGGIVFGGTAFCRAHRSARGPAGVRGGRRLAAGNGRFRAAPRRSTGATWTDGAGMDLDRGLRRLHGHHERRVLLRCGGAAARSCGHAALPRTVRGRLRRVPPRTGLGPSGDRLDRRRTHQPARNRRQRRRRSRGAHCRRRARRLHPLEPRCGTTGRSGPLGSQRRGIGGGADTVLGCFRTVPERPGPRDPRDNGSGRCRRGVLAGLPSSTTHRKPCGQRSVLPRPGHRSDRRCGPVEPASRLVDRGRPGRRRRIGCGCRDDE